MAFMPYYNVAIQATFHSPSFSLPLRASIMTSSAPKADLNIAATISYSCYIGEEIITILNVITKFIS